MPTIKELSLRDYTEGDLQTRDEFSQELFEGLKELGFIVLKDHPVDTELLANAYKKTSEFFNLQTEQKKRYVVGKGGQRGYTPFGKEHAKDRSVPDLKEFWHVGRELPSNHPDKEFFPDNVWPNEIQDFKKIFMNLFEALDETGQIMLRALTGPLQVETDYFDRMTDDGSSILRVLHYPPIPEGTDPRCVRAAAHEDINLITLLVTASSSGLELLTHEGEWMPVETDPKNIIVDSGDMLARITNDVIPATTHRVVNPRDATSSRYSMPFFMHPHPKAVLTCLDSCRGPGQKYEDITANDFLMQRLREIGLI